MGSPTTAMSSPGETVGETLSPSAGEESSRKEVGEEENGDEGTKEAGEGKSGGDGGDDGSGGNKEEEDGENDDEDDDDDEPVLYHWTEVKKDGTSEQVIEQWSPDHAKILYMMSLYARAAASAEENEGWIRSIPLLVLLYEGIVAGAIDFDYAPCSTLITQDGKSKRVFLNITQEGKAAVDDLREKEHINGLKLSTEDFQPVTAYQVSHKGLDFIKQIPKEMKKEIDDYIHSPAGNLLQIKFIAGEIKEVPIDQVDPGVGDGGESDDEDEGEGGGEDTGGSDDDDDDDDSQGQFLLVDQSTGFEKESSCTDAEDVSYVSSPYLPSCVRNPRDQRAFTSNAHRRHESAAGEDNVRDELDEAITLAYVLTMVGEWIPFGANQIVALNERLGAMDRCQGGLFTSVVDNKGESR